MTIIYQPAEDSFFLSEILKDILEASNEKSSVKILEIGCGSGIQLQTIKKAGINKQNIFSCDVNGEAVNHCKKLGFSSVKSDLFEKINGKIRRDPNSEDRLIKKNRGFLYDIITFNPPYLPKDKREPKDSQLATTGGKKGSEIINKFLKQAKSHLAKNGKIILLTSSLTKGIRWQGYKKKLLGKKKLFMEELYVWELRK